MYKICNEINNRNYSKRKIESIGLNTNYIKKQKLNVKFIEPNTYKDIFDCDDKEEWLADVNEELYNMKKLKVYTSVIYQIILILYHQNGYSNTKRILKGKYSKEMLV